MEPIEPSGHAATIDRPASGERAARPDPAARTRPGRCARALFLLFTGFYLLTGSGHLYSVDEETLYRVSESLVERRTLALPPDAWGLVVSEQATGGLLYSQYEPGQSLLAVPLYLLGRAVAPLFPAEARGYIVRLFVGWFGALVTAATVALLYLLARALGYREGAALGLAAIYGLATMAWPYARTFFAEPLTALFLVAAFLALQHDRMRSTEYGMRNRDVPAAVAQPEARHHSTFRTPYSAFLVSGLAAGAALATKPHAALALAPLGVYLLWRVVGIPARQVGWAQAVRRGGRDLLAWGAGLALVGVPLLVCNAALYGGPLHTGYSAGRLTYMAYPFLRGLYGIALSSGKGLIWYSPPLLLAILAARPFWRRHRAEALLCLAIVVFNVAFYSRLTLWNGDWAWGPRYLLIVLPFALLPLVALLEGLREHRARLALVAAVVTLGVAVQLLGVLVNFLWDHERIYNRPATDAERQALMAARYFSPPDSPLVMHARLLAARADEWRGRAFPPPDTAVLRGGFAEEGGPFSPILPRWTTGAGRIGLHAGAGAPLVVRLTFFDHRPPALRREGLAPAVLLDGARLDDAAIERRDFSGTGEGWTYQFVVPAEALRRGSGRQATVTLASPTWNPRAAGVGTRDESVGVYLHGVEVWHEGRPWQVREAPALLARRAIEPLPAPPRRLYAWLNSGQPLGRDGGGADVHHLVDHWAWYAAVGGLGRGWAGAWIAAYAFCTGAIFLAGAVLLLRSLPAGALARRRRPRQWGAARRATPSRARPGKPRRGRSRPV